MPSAGSRSFDFLDIATEAVSAVEIYKTSKANLPTGGIGATVNMITARPLDVGFQSVVGVKAVHETSAGEGRDLDDFTPEISGLFSNVFADDTIGFLVSASYQERQNREEFSEVDWLDAFCLGIRERGLGRHYPRADERPAGTAVCAVRQVDSDA